MTGAKFMSSLSLHILYDIFYLRTKFGDFCYSRSGDITAGVEIENGSCDPDHAPFRGGLSSIS